MNVWMDGLVEVVYSRQKTRNPQKITILTAVISSVQFTLCLDVPRSKANKNIFLCRYVPTHSIHFNFIVVLLKIGGDELCYVTVLHTHLLYGLQTLNTNRQQHFLLFFFLGSIGRKKQ
jgi:hypothetical protein